MAGIYTTVHALCDRPFASPAPGFDRDCAFEGRNGERLAVEVLNALLGPSRDTEYDYCKSPQCSTCVRFDGTLAFDVSGPGRMVTREAEEHPRIGRRETRRHCSAPRTSGIGVDQSCSDGAGSDWTGVSSFPRQVSRLGGSTADQLSLHVNRLLRTTVWAVGCRGSPRLRRAQRAVRPARREIRLALAKTWDKSIRASRWPALGLAIGERIGVLASGSEQRLGGRPKGVTRRPSGSFGPPGRRTLDP